MGEYTAVLIYDGECPYCSTAARALRRIRGIGAIPWYDERAQAFLEAQFDATPFAMTLVDRKEGRVYAGEAAARELSERAGLPDFVSELVGDGYESIAELVGKAAGRDRDPDDYHETYELTPDARDRFDELAEGARHLPLATTD